VQSFLEDLGFDFRKVSIDYNGAKGLGVCKVIIGRFLFFEY